MRAAPTMPRGDLNNHARRGVQVAGRGGENMAVDDYRGEILPGMVDDQVAEAFLKNGEILLTGAKWRIGSKIHNNEDVAIKRDIQHAGFANIVVMYSIFISEGKTKPQPPLKTWH
ncbi:hypothetical protein FJT64_017587 [Amphibalanus amphitrite]|uniref:Uncharacterized protein n=1 Tax=Amphibalanus amphitrite TaxID=1232801 RepID=A0A6A4X0B9_AMPAM|nr:hypothetical protein FJT64_017587 [Amphibalanus amphitrite]